MNIGDLDWVASLNDSQFQTALNRMDRNVGRTTANIENQGRQLENYARRATEFAGAFFSIQAAQGFITSLVEVRSQFQQLDIAFSTMLKSKAASDALMKELVVFAGTTPFGLKEAAGAAKQLLAYGSTAKTVVGELRMLGDVASGVSVPISDLVYLYGTLKTQGRAYAMDIRQFAGRGIPIYAELAKVLKVGKDEVAGLVEAGKVGFPQVEQAFKNMTAAGGMFGGLMEAQSQAWKGQIERFKDAWDVMLNDIAKGQEGMFANGIEAATDMVENYQQVLDILGLMIYAYGSYRAALVAYAVANSFATASVVTHGLAVRRLTVMETLLAASKRVLISLQATYNAVLAASPIGATIALLAALGAVIYSLTQYTSAAEATQERFNKIQSEGGLSAAKEANNIKALVNVIKSQTATNEQRIAAYKKLQETTKGVLAGFSQEEIAAGKAKNAIDAYIQSIREASVAKTAFNEFQKLNDQMAELEVNGAKSISMMDKAALRAKALGNFLRLSAATNFSNANGPLLGLSEEMKKEFREAQKIAFGTGADDALVSQTKEKVQKELDALSKKFGSQITGELTKGGEADSAVVASKKRSTDAIDAEIKKIKEEQSAVAETSDQWAKYAVQIRKLEDEKTKITGKASATIKTEESAIKRQAEMLQKIYQLNDKYNDKSLTDDEQKLAQIRGEFKALQDDIDIYNKDSRNKKVNPNLKPQMEKAIENQEYENETERIKAGLEKQKALYADYEEYKSQVGRAAATARYENEINTSRTFLEKLKEEAKALEQDPLTMTGPQIERLKYLYTQINEGEQAQKQAYQEAYVAAMSHEDKIRVIREKYVEYAKQLGAGLTESQKAELIKQQNDEIEAANETAFQKTAIYKKLAEQTVLYTREALKAEIKAAENILKDSGLSPALKADVEKHIEELNEALDLGVNNSNTGALEQRKKTLETALLDPLIAGTEQAKAYREELLRVQGLIDNMGAGSGRTVDIFKGGTAQVAGNIAGGFSQLSSSFGELSSSLEGVNDDLAYTLGSIGELMSVAEDAAGAVASFAAGDIIGGVTKTISAVAGLFSIGKKVKEMNAAARQEVTDYYEAAIAGEREYQALLRKRELDEVARGKTSYQALLAQLELLKKQSPEVKAAYDKIFASLQGQEYASGKDSKHGTWFRKAKTWDIMASLAGSNFNELEKLYTQGKLADQAKKDFEALRELREELKAAGLDVEDLQNQLNEMLTGTSVEGLSDALSDLFANGKLAAADFGDTFENIMHKAIVNAFKYNVIQKAMAPLFDALSGMFENGAMPGEQQITDWLDLAKGVGAGLGSQFQVFDEMMEKLGLGSKETTSPNSLKGAYSTASQESISFLAGQTAGMRLAQLEANALLTINGKTSLELLQVGTRKLDALLKIEQHTGNAVVELKNAVTELKGINNKMSSPGNAATAAGYN